MTVEEIITKFGSQAEMARALNVDPPLVHHWKRRNSIPAWRHDAILKAAIDRRIDLTRADLERLRR